MTWTEWRALASGAQWYPEILVYDGPACYELALGGPQGGQLQTVYVGETENEMRRMAQYGQHGSHLADMIADALRKGWTLYYRGWAASSKADSKQKQDGLLAKFRYPWNGVGA